MGRLNENAEKVFNYQKSKQLKEFLERRNKNRKALGLNGSKQEMLDLVNKLKIKSELLEGEAGIKRNDSLKTQEEKQLDEIEQSISEGNLYTATEQFGLFLHNAYDGTNTNEKSPRCTTLWTLRHYVDINRGTVITRSDKLAKRLLDAAESSFTDNRCNKKKVYSVTKEEREELGFSFSQLQRLNCIFANLKQNMDVSMDRFLDMVEKHVDGEIANQKCLR